MQPEKINLEPENKITQAQQIGATLGENQVWISVTPIQTETGKSEFTSDSRLEQLILYDVCIESNRPAREVNLTFSHLPSLPGVIITTDGKFTGIMSRQRFFDRIRNSAAWDFFAKQSLLTLYQLAQTEALVLPSNTPILTAARQCLMRAKELVYEPIVVQNAQGIYQLVDVHQLLLAQCQINESVTATLSLQTSALEKVLQELQKTQAQLIHAEKISSLGQLVAGVAHEINNPLNCISSNLPHARRYTEDLLHLLQLYAQQYPQATQEIQAEAAAIDLEFIEQDLVPILSAMEQGAERIGEISKALRNFARIEEPQRKLTNIHDAIDSTLLILHHRLKAKKGHPEIKIIKDYGNLPLVECYPGQLNQVFMNLLGNAIDALEEGNQSSASLPSTSKGYPEESLLILCHELENPTIAIRTEVINESWIQIRIADNGLGMTESVKKYLFNPFFTTKPAGKGTGLGLSISYQIIVEKHLGKLTCSSELGQGTEFAIALPFK